MSELRTNAEELGTTAAEIRAEIPRYREMAEVVTEVILLTSALVALAAIVVIVRTITKE
jgi:hypothetical protein